MSAIQSNYDQERRGFKRKDIRLSGQKYLGKQIYFVTICCDGRRQIFSEHWLANCLIENLLAAAVSHSFSIHAYCVMPDHVHILAEGLHESCDLLKFVSSLKQKSGFSYRQKYAKPLWQKKYYDHILRKADEVEPVSTYIWLNPVRKGLCVAPQDYPYSGSETLEWTKHLAPHRLWTPPWRIKCKDAGLKPAATKCKKRKLPGSSGATLNIHVANFFLQVA